MGELEREAAGEEVSSTCESDWSDGMTDGRGAIGVTNILTTHAEPGREAMTFTAELCGRVSGPGR